MASGKVSRKKLLKEPDEFISTTGQVIQFVKTHRRRVSQVVVAVLIVIAAVAGGISYLRWQEGKALAIQDQALQLFQEAYRASMENPAADKKDDFRKAADKFKESLSVYSRGRTGQVSELFIGHCYFSMKEYDQAQAAYAKCLDGPFRNLALNGMAYLFEAKGDYQKALENFEKNMENRNQPYQVEALLGAARCYEALKQKPKALEIYEKALAQAPQSSAAEFIRWKVSELKG